MRTGLGVLALLVLAGCMGAAEDSGVPDASKGDVGTLHWGEILAWDCPAGCDATSFAVDVPAGFDGWMHVRVLWDGTKVTDMPLTVQGPSGPAVIGERGFDDRRAEIMDPVAGTYVVGAVPPGASFTARLGSLDIPADGPLLPNLVELVIEGPEVGPCDDVEKTEQGAVKCMRFGNGVGNPGNGPMQIRLTLEQGAQALAPLGGHFSQEVRVADGSLAAHDVGPATFHATHSHWHYDGFAIFELFRVDPATGLRGELASSHHKSGFCFLDWDKMPENTTVPAEQERAETDCLIPGLGAALSTSTEPPAWTNGISRGWYDFYEPQLTDQYVDIDGLAPGTYELVATADPQHTLDEVDTTDNQSSLLLHIDGDVIDVLEERAHYRVQDVDDH